MKPMLNSYHQSICVNINILTFSKPMKQNTFHLLRLEQVRPDLEKIIENLYIGDETSTSNQKLLLDLNIRGVITVAEELSPKLCKELAHCCIPIKDSKKTEIYKYFDETNNFIKEFVDKENKKSGVLIHCRMGKSRSATIICAYLMNRYKIGADEALNLVKRKRNGANPNQGFIHQLKIYQKVLKQKNA